MKVRISNRNTWISGYITNVVVIILIITCLILSLNYSFFVFVALFLLGLILFYNFVTLRRLRTVFVDSNNIYITRLHFFRKIKIDNVKKVNSKFFSSNVPIIDNELHTVFYLNDNDTYCEIDIHPSHSNREMFNEFKIQVNSKNKK